MSSGGYRRRVRPVPLALITALYATPSGAGRFSAELSAGLGYDSELYFDAAALATDGQPTAAQFVLIAPELSLAIGRATGHRLLANYGATLRQFFIGDARETLVIHGLDLHYLPASFWSIQAGLWFSLGQLYTRELAGAGWRDVSGGVSLRRGLLSWLSGELTYQYAHTRFGSLSSATRQHGNVVALALQAQATAGLSFHLRYGLMAVNADPDDLDSLRHHPSVGLQFRGLSRSLSLQAGYRLTTFELTTAVSRVNPQGKPLPDGTTQRRDWIHAPFLSASWTYRPWCAFTLSYAPTWGRSNVEQSYNRHVLVASARFSFGRSWRSPPPATTSAAEGIAVDASGVMHLRLRLHNAKRVAVVGTFNNWDPQAGWLRLAPEKAWVGHIRIGAGSHRFLLWIDGHTQLPPSCPRRVPDAFGGENCALSVELPTQRRPSEQQDDRNEQ